jgi:hypothetical protein
MNSRSCLTKRDTGWQLDDLSPSKSTRILNRLSALARKTAGERVIVRQHSKIIRPNARLDAYYNKNTMIKSMLGVICSAALLIGLAHAQTSGTTTASGAESTGTIKEYTGSVLVVETLVPNEPIQFKLSKKVTYVDADGKVVEAPGLTTNQKVRVHYIKVGGDNVADKVTLIGN